MEGREVRSRELLGDTLEERLASYERLVAAGLMEAGLVEELRRRAERKAVPAA